MVPYYNNQIGLSFHDLMIGEAVFAGIIILMEVPSGWMSDVWSRKGTIIIGSVCAAIGYSIMLYAYNLPTAIVGQAIIGVGVAFNSGTVTSILYDSLAMNGKEHLYQRLEGKRHAMGLYAIAIASVLGGIFYQVDPYIPLKLDVVTLCLAMVAAFLIVEPNRIKKTSEHHPIKDMMVTIKYALHGHKEIAGIIIVSTVLFCSTKMFMWSQQPYMQSVNISTEWFGYIMAGGFLFSGFCGHFGHKINHNMSNRRMIAFMVCVAIL
jgi:MFS family permease